MSTTVRGGAELRVRRAQVLFESLHAARAAYLRDPGQGGSLELNLFEDVGFKAVVLRSAPTASGYSLSGRLEGVPHGTVTLVVNGDVLIGTVRTPQAIYTVESGGSDPARIRQVDPSVLPPLGEPLVLPPRGSAQPEATSATRIAAVDDDQLIRIDVLVVYTSEVRRLKGDRAMVEALVDHWIADANHAYADSGVYQRLFLARAAEVVYEETGNSSTDIERLLSSDDGFMDSVHGWAEDTRSDVVHLIVGQSNVLGLAYLNPVHPGYADRAFSLSRYDAVTYTLAHEIGHNMGLSHDRFRYADDWPDTEYAHGYVNQNGLRNDVDASRRWRTIMAEPASCSALGFSCPKLRRFSNPKQTHLGDPLGVPAGNGVVGVAGPADASRALNEGRMTVACYRAGVSDLSVDVSLATRILQPGATVDMDVKVGNRCGTDAPPGAGTLYRSTDANVGPDDSELGTFELDGVAGGQTITLSIPVLAPSDPGTYYYGACVRSAGTERGVADNCSPGVYATVEPQGRLRVIGLYDGRVEENQTWTSSTPAVDGATGAVLWSGSGADRFEFSIDATTGVVTLPPRDYEAPTDANRNNIYEVIVKATDAAGQHGQRFIEVWVSDVDEGSEQPGNESGGGSEFLNTPPVVERQIEDQVIHAGQTLELDIYLSFYDRDERSLDYFVESSNPSVATVEIDRQGLLTIRGAGGGVTRVTVTAADDEGARVSQRFRVAVHGPIPVALFPRASDPVREGFVRVINHSAVGGEVSVEAIDDRGNRVGPATLPIEGGAVVHFNSVDLEDGNAAKGLAPGVGPGEGDWRLVLDAELDIEVLSYVRTGDGFLTSMHDVVPTRDGVHHIATFNPGSNPNQIGVLRLINPGTADAELTVTGIDDAGALRGTGVRVDIPPGQAMTLTAADLESGAGVDGALGDGAGKWRLTVASAQPVVAMSLLESPGGHLTNLSTSSPIPVSPVQQRPAEEVAHLVPLFPSASDSLGRQGFVRVANRSAESAEVRIRPSDDRGTLYHDVTLTIGAGETAHFNSNDLELGNSQKGLAGRTGAGTGDWWLVLSSERHIEVLSYIRTADGFLTSMHDVAPSVDGGHWVATFNPASNVDQVSSLRLVNPDTDDANVRISGIDDAGKSPRLVVALTLPAGTSRTVTASELESGGYGLDGALGDGAGKWRLRVVSERPVVVMSLLSSPTGHLSNLSTGEGRTGT